MQYSSNMYSIGSGLHRNLYGAIGLLPPSINERVIGALFDRKFRTADPWQYGSRAEEFERITAIVNAAAGTCSPRQIIELGCAEGALSRALTNRFPDAFLYGVDISPRAIARAKEKAAPSRSSFEVADVRNWSPRRLSTTADLIVACDVLYYLGSKTAVRELTERMADWLEPGGIVVFGHAHDRARVLHSQSSISEELESVAELHNRRLSYGISIYRKVTTSELAVPARPVLSLA